MRRVLTLIALLLAAVLVVAACSSGDEAGDVDDAAAEDPEPRSVGPSPELEPGSTVTAAVQLDGQSVEFAVFAPQGFAVGEEAPVLLALPPGGQSLEQADAVLQRTYAPEAARLGWVVVSPAAPDGVLYFQGSEALIPGFLDYVGTWVRPEGDRFHLAGISNGGISGFRIAGESPDRFASLTVLPGYPSTDADDAALADLTGIPVRMFVGELDTGWVAPMRAADERLTSLGGDVELEIVAGENHIIAALADGVSLFALLEAARG